MACPACGHEQLEARLAISSDCRACGEHFEINHGRPASKPRRPTFFRDEQQAPSRFGVRSLLKMVTGPRQMLLRLLVDPPARREVGCFSCQHRHAALATASATHCPACGTYISLRDYDIREPWTRGIETRGNVKVHRGGSITGGSVRCHHLEVDGKFSGTVECSGDFILRSSAMILGHVRCHHLRIERRARVEFSAVVEAAEATIDGEFSGNLVCAGRLLLRKKALLTGDISVGSLMIKDGARHHGTVVTRELPAEA